MRESGSLLFIIRLVPLSDAVSVKTELVLITRNRNAVPEIEGGITQGIVPETVRLCEPIMVPLVNLPNESDNSTDTTFVESKSPNITQPTFRLDPAHRRLTVAATVVINL